MLSKTLGCFLSLATICTAQPQAYKAMSGVVLGAVTKGYTADYTVDSVNGLDTNTGVCTPAQIAAGGASVAGCAWQHVSKVLALTQTTGQSFCFMGGSYFREMMITRASNVAVMGCGPGTTPVALSAGGWTKTGGQTNIYQIANPWANGSPSISEDGYYFSRMYSLSVLDSSPGAFYCGAVTCGSTLYVNATDNSNPGTNGKSYFTAVWPMFDASDILSKGGFSAASGVFSSFTNTYTFQWSSTRSDAPGSDWFSLWEDGIRFIRVGDVNAVNTTPGSYAIVPTAVSSGGSCVVQPTLYLTNIANLGTITAATGITTGIGCVTPPTITVTPVGPTGAGAVITPVLGSGGTAGQVVSYTVSNQGGGYNEAQNCTGTCTVYMQASDGSNPGSNAFTYEGSKREFGVDAYTQNLSGVLVQNVQTKRNLGNDGSIRCAKYGVCRNIVAYEGSKHNCYGRPGTYLNNVACVEAYPWTSQTQGNEHIILYDDVYAGEGNVSDHVQASDAVYPQSPGQGYNSHHGSGSTGPTVARNSTVHNLAAAFSALSELSNSTTVGVGSSVTYYGSMTMNNDVFSNNGTGTGDIITGGTTNATLSLNNVTSTGAKSAILPGSTETVNVAGSTLTSTNNPIRLNVGTVTLNVNNSVLTTTGSFFYNIQDLTSFIYTGNGNTFHNASAKWHTPTCLAGASAYCPQTSTDYTFAQWKTFTCAGAGGCQDTTSTNVP